MLNFNNQLHDLARKNNRLKSKLRHAQLKNNTFKLNHSKKQLDLILKEYKNDKSLIKASFNSNIDKSNVINAYVEGSRGNSEFREFFTQINEINNPNFKRESEPVKDYTLNNEGDTWIYTTVIDGEKISLISSDYRRLCEKIKERQLPF